MLEVFVFNCHWNHFGQPILEWCEKILFPQFSSQMQTNFTTNWSLGFSISSTTFPLKIVKNIYLSRRAIFEWYVICRRTTSN